MPPFRASYFYVFLTWESGEGIADTLGNIASAAFLLLFVCCLYFAWLTNICHPTFFRCFFFCNNKNLIEVWNEQQVEGFHLIAYHWMGLVWEGCKPLVSSCKSPNILGSGVWFHPGGNTSGRSHPGLRKNKVFLFVPFSWFGFIVFFSCNITPGWNLTGGFLLLLFCFFYFLHPEKSETQRGDWTGGQVNLLSALLKANLSHCIPKRHLLKQKYFPFYDENEISLRIYMYLFDCFSIFRYANQLLFCFTDWFLFDESFTSEWLSITWQKKKKMSSSNYCNLTK